MHWPTCGHMECQIKDALIDPEVAAAERRHVSVAWAKGSHL